MSLRFPSDNPTTRSTRKLRRDRFQVAHVKADTIVLDTKDAFLVGVESVQLHARARSRSAVLECIRDQVDPCLTQQRVVAPCLRQGAYRNFRVRAAICQSQVGADLCHQSSRIEARSLDRLIPYSRQSQQGLDNVSRFSYGVPDDPDLPSPLVTQFGAMILFEHAGEAVKRPQRRPQVV